MGTSLVGSIDGRREDLPELRRSDIRRAAAVADVLRLWMACSEGLKMKEE